MYKLLLLLALTFVGYYSWAQPANDDPCAATSLTTGASCTFSTYTNAAATASAGVPAPGCASYSGGDVWFSVVVPANGQVTIDMNTGVITDSGLGLYTGTCGSLTLLSCDDDSSPNGNMSYLAATGLTPGSTLFIRVWEYGNNGNGTFSICATSPAAGPGSGDEPCSATSLTPGASCVYTAGTTVGSTNSAGIPAPGCASYSGPDVWYSFVVPASGSVQINSNSGTTTDSGMALYSGACGSLTLISCDDDSSPNGAMSLINASGLTPGATVYVRMWDYGGGTGTFSICVTTSTACGGAANNDYCPYPAQLTQGPGSFSASTDVTFTADQPGNVSSVFCGSIENNSWYQFTASGTTASFPITYVGGCVSGWGIQAHVYAVTYTGGCCSGFTSMSNCYNPGNTTLGTVSATGLTSGQQYLLMIDGNSGDGCEFTISGWTGTGILPVELVDLKGISTDLGNHLTWRTLSELKNESFQITHSLDGTNYTVIGKIDGAGTTTVDQYYEFIHETAPKGINYYQLVQVDQDGRQNPSEVITVNRKEASGQTAVVYPNPTKNSSTIEYLSETPDEVLVTVFDQFGSIVFNEVFSLKAGPNQLNLPSETWKNGVYSITTKTDAVVLQKKLIKVL